MNCDDLVLLIYGFYAVFDLKFISAEKKAHTHTSDISNENDCRTGAWSDNTMRQLSHFTLLAMEQLQKSPNFSYQSVIFKKK